MNAPLLSQVCLAQEVPSLAGMDHGKGGAAVQVHVVKAEGIDASSRSMYVEVTQHDEASSAPPSGVMYTWATNSSSLPFFILGKTTGPRTGSKQCTLRLSSSRIRMRCVFSQHSTIFPAPGVLRCWLARYFFSPESV